MLNIKLPSPLAKGLAIATLGIGCPLMLYASTFPTRAWCDVQQNGTSVTATPIGQKSDFYWFLVGLGVAQGFAAWQLYRAVFEAKSTTETAGSLPASTLQEVGAMPAWTAPTPVREEIAYTVPISSTIPVQVTPEAWGGSGERDYSAPTPGEKQVDTAWFTRARGYKLVQIFGGQGSGKSTLAKALVRERVAKGHYVEVWDVHRDAMNWIGLPVYGGGMNYKAVDERMKWAHKLIESRYQEIDQKGEDNCNFQPVTIVVEELTNMAKRCEASDDFYEAALSDIRKVSVFVLFISHDRTLAASGGSKGLARARDASMLEIELFASSDPTTGEERPTGKGRMKLPGEAQEKIDIEIAPWMMVPKGFDYRSVMPQQRSESVQSDPEQTESRTPEPTLNESRTLSPDKDYSDSEPAENQVELEEGDANFIAELGLETDEAKLNRINQLKAAGLNQEQIILAIWGAKKGGSKAYRTALDEYKRLTHEG
ncbi:ATP-binding protein [Planktothrix sp. FACHB-1355]|uniref:ATP-binding protein n=1 Tax=Aerosakkonema funiforme FACHB-1375 TaxID=2949571 RepID=A0A926ZJW9_9CYAN|nr:MULTISPECIES: ATP-binding protein [Oscillatoriales]MBD2184807.1 ATP-binding protein [Aerosakkonema funiforme FACHB-1375]MBD3557455.1 ATP-binding protein [Planktothrix sp. FACHB-1355]